MSPKQAKLSKWNEIKSSGSKQNVKKFVKKSERFMREILKISRL